MTNIKLANELYLGIIKLNTWRRVVDRKYEKIIKETAGERGGETGRWGWNWAQDILEEGANNENETRTNGERMI